MAEEEVAAFVAAARRATGLPIEPCDTFGFGDSAAMADELAVLVGAGPKRATAGLLAEYEADGTPLPVAGDWSVVLDGAGRPVAVIRTVQVAVVPFAEVDAAFAWDEGEGDRSLAFWREAHRGFFSRSGLPFDDGSPVVCERFEVVYPLPTREGMLPT
ncbi:MAG: ASCH domain-containing protein [Chloroflexia bacterium]|nr:ASCH domain-containing protein [Chloroflexia bacterium]